MDEMGSDQPRTPSKVLGRTRRERILKSAALLPVGANVRLCCSCCSHRIFAIPVTHAAVCAPGFHGVYGLSLTGTTTIGGSTRPVAVVGRLMLDDSGSLSGISSASFTGLILGNRVTGKYEARYGLLCDVDLAG